MCPDFGHNFKTDSPFTKFAKIFFTLKKLNFVNDEVWTGCQKLGLATLLIRKEVVQFAPELRPRPCLLGQYTFLSLCGWLSG